MQSNIYLKSIDTIHINTIHKLYSKVGKNKIFSEFVTQIPNYPIIESESA